MAKALPRSDFYAYSLSISVIGFKNVCDNHYQIENGVIVNEIKNTGKSGYEEKCESCPYGLSEEDESSRELLDELLKAYE